MPDIEGPYIVTAPLDLEAIKAHIRFACYYHEREGWPDRDAGADIAALVAEVERLTRVLTALVDDSEGQQHRVAWQDACEVLHGHRGPEVG